MKTIVVLLLTLSGLQAHWASAQTFTFQVDGPDTHNPTPSPGIGYGTIQYSPGALTLSLTYSSLSAPIKGIDLDCGFSQVFWPGAVWSGEVVTFFANSQNPLPTSGTFTRTYSNASVDQTILDSLSGGLAYLEIRTLSYPYLGQGEIGGVVPAPEPGGPALVATGLIALGFTRKLKRPVGGRKRLFHSSGPAKAAW